MCKGPFTPWTITITIKIYRTILCTGVDANRVVILLCETEKQKIRILNAKMYLLDFANLEVGTLKFLRL